jgi:hypothetical protein
MRRPNISAPEPRSPSGRVSATTAAGIAAERIALADRERRAARAAARAFEQRPASR